MAEALDFSSYLASVTRHYEKWWTLYTLTDAESQKKLEARNSALASPFDFGMLVQEVKPEKENPESPENSEREDPESSKESEAKPEKRETLPVLDGLRKYAQEHVVLVGHPGSGKSTALLRLLLEEAKAALTPSPSPKIGRGKLEGVSEKECKIPVLIELRFWQTSVVDRMLAFLHRHDPNLDLDESALIALLRQGQFLLLVDGLNELPSEEAKRDVTRFRQDFPQVSMVFTRRDLSLGGDFGLEKKLEMQPLKDAQMRQFVMAYLPEQGEQLLRQLKDRMRGFAETPLLLWMLCSLFQQTGKIPPNLGMVFRQFTRGFEKIKQDVPVSDESRRWWSELLQYLAFVMMQGKPEENPLSPLSPPPAMVSILRSEAKSIFEEFLRERVSDPGDRAAECLDDLLEHHLIQENGEQIEFRHQLIQEYYAAEYLLSLLPDLSDEELQQDFLNYLKWTEAIALTLALSDKEVQTTQIVGLALKIDLNLGAKLAGEVRAEIQAQTINLILELNVSQILKFELLSKTKSDFAAKYLISVLKTEAFSSRKVIDSLGEIRSNLAVEPLIIILSNGNSDANSEIINALGKIGDEAAIPKLLEMLDDEDLRFFDNPIRAIGEIDGENAVNVLYELIKHTDPHIRRQVIEVLGKTGKELRLELLQSLFSDEDPFVRLEAAKLIGSQDSRRTVLMLMQLLKNENFQDHQSIGATLMAICDEALIADLLSRSEHENSLTQRIIIEIVGETGDKIFVKTLLDLLRHGNSNIRESIITALGNIGDETALSALLDALHDEDWLVQVSAAEALGKIGNEQSIPDLIQTLNDEDRDVSGSAAQALGEIGTKEAISGIIEVLKDRDSNFLLLDSFSQFQTERFIVSALQALKDKDSEVHQKVIKVLKNIGSESILLSSFQELHWIHESKPDTWNWISTAEVLGLLGSDEAINVLLQLLQDNYPGFRESAARALGNIGKTSLIPELLKLLNDEELYVREAVVEALGKICGEETVSALQQVFFESLAIFDDRSYSSNLHWITSNALIRIGSPKPLPQLTNLLEKLQADDPDEEKALIPKILVLTRTILNIQENCQFYNYEVAEQKEKRLALGRQSAAAQPLTQTTTYHIGQVGILNQNPTIHGGQTGIQQNKAQPQEDE